MNITMLVPIADMTALIANIMSFVCILLANGGICQGAKKFILTGNAVVLHQVLAQ
jgi:hypothetical protein